MLYCKKKQFLTPECKLCFHIFMWSVFHISSLEPDADSDMWSTYNEDAYCTKCNYAINISNLCVITWFQYREFEPSPRTKNKAGINETWADLIRKNYFISRKFKSQNIESFVKRHKIFEDLIIVISTMSEISTSIALEFTSWHWIYQLQDHLHN